MENWFSVLNRRAGLETAIAGRDERGLVPILTFLTRYVNDPGYSEILMRVTNVVLGKVASLYPHARLYLNSCNCCEQMSMRTVT